MRASSTGTTPRPYYVCECMHRVLGQEAIFELELPKPGNPRLTLDPFTRSAYQHERRHREQRAMFAPRWCQVWLPELLCSLIGARAFWRQYEIYHHDRGWLHNPFEVEARRSEEDETVRTPPAGLPPAAAAP